MERKGKKVKEKKVTWQSLLMISKACPWAFVGIRWLASMMYNIKRNIDIDDLSVVTSVLVRAVCSLPVLEML